MTIRILYPDHRKKLQIWLSSKREFNAKDPPIMPDMFTSSSKPTFYSPPPAVPKTLVYLDYINTVLHRSLLLLHVLLGVPIPTWAFSQGYVCSEQPLRVRKCFPWDKYRLAYYQRDGFPNSVFLKRKSTARTASIWVHHIIPIRIGAEVHAACCGMSNKSFVSDPGVLGPLPAYMT